MTDGERKASAYAFRSPNAFAARETSAGPALPDDPGSGKQDGKVYERRNQRSNPLKSRIGSNLVDTGRIAAHVRAVAWTTPSPVNGAGPEALGKDCGIPRARL